MGQSFASLHLYNYMFDMRGLSGTTFRMSTLGNGAIALHFHSPTIAQFVLSGRALDSRVSCFSFWGFETTTGVGVGSWSLFVDACTR